ncbi:MAG: peptidoglycan DD-metalloendopeptidase family protein [Sulfurovum sp.]
MNRKFLLLILLSSSILFANNIDNKISSKKKLLNKSSTIQSKTKVKIKELAQKIDSQNKDLEKLEKDISSIDKDIKKHAKLLKQSENKLQNLKEKSTYLKEKKNKNESQIVDTIIQDFTSSIALNLASKANLKEMVDKEVYTILSENSKYEISKLDNNYEQVTSNANKNKKTINKISNYIQEREKTKKTLNNLKRKHSSSLGNLEIQHRLYQQELKKVVSQQESLKDLLGQLNILKKKEIQKERKRKEKLAQLRFEKKKVAKKKVTKKSTSPVATTAKELSQSFENDLDLNDVRKIGSSTSGIKITRYKGSKTIAPLKNFDVVKKFGTYYDPVYKIKLFNESIVLKTKRPKAKVVTILNGKIVYAKKNAGMLENVVIVQHRNGLHTIYSHLDEIAPTLRVGKWVKKGYVVGRVNDSLMFQATKNSYHINPKDLFKI